MLLWASADSETRTLTRIGGIFVLCVMMIGLLVWANPFHRSNDRLLVAINMPYAVPGIGKGTPVVMHGVKIGEVTGATSLPAGGLRLDTALRPKPVEGLTAAASVDFRPADYFGVSAVNLTAGTGGRPLYDGMTLTTVPKGNFGMQALMSRVNDLSGGVLTPQMIGVLDKVTRYSDGLTPLIETVFTTAKTIANVQNVSTERLLARTAGITVTTPSLIAAVTDLGNSVINNPTKTWPKELFEDQLLNLTDHVVDALFGKVGRLEGSHIDELLPAVNTVKALMAPVPGLISPDGVSQMLVEARKRFEQMWGGTPEERALKVRIVLDKLPSVAAVTGLPEGPE